MAFLKRVDNAESVSRFARDLDRLAYSLFILRSRIEERIGRYAAILKAIEAGNSLDLFDENSKLQLTPEEKEEVRHTLRSPINRNSEETRILLLRLDSMLAEEGAQYDQKIITVEHVLPRNPEIGSQWMTWFPDEAVRGEWVNKLANLVLLSRKTNARAKNYEFDRKKDEYFQKHGVTTFALTVQVINEEKWTPEKLESRQNYLCNKMIEEWRL